MVNIITLIILCKKIIIIIINVIIIIKYVKYMKITINITICKTRSYCNTNIPSLIRHQPENGFLKKPKHVADNHLNLKLCTDTVYCSFIY
jgi:hypothetical protein